VNPRKVRDVKEERGDQSVGGRTADSGALMRPIAKDDAAELKDAASCSECIRTPLTRDIVSRRFCRRQLMSLYIRAPIVLDPDMGDKVQKVAVEEKKVCSSTPPPIYRTLQRDVTRCVRLPDCSFCLSSPICILTTSLSPFTVQLNPSNTMEFVPETKPFISANKHTASLLAFMQAGRGYHR
jgi:hypothetical protein